LSLPTSPSQRPGSIRFPSFFQGSLVSLHIKRIERITEFHIQLKDGLLPSMDAALLQFIEEHSIAH
jgi:hypothetical protein